MIEKGRRAIEKIERSKNCMKWGKSPPGSGSSTVAQHSNSPGQKCRGRAAAAWPVLGSKKVQVPSRSRKKSRRKQQVSGSRPWRVSQHAGLL